MPEQLEQIVVSVTNAEKEALAYELQRRNTKRPGNHIPDLPGLFRNWAQDLENGQRKVNAARNKLNEMLAGMSAEEQLAWFQQAGIR